MMARSSKRSTVPMNAAASLESSGMNDHTAVTASLSAEYSYMSTEVRPNALTTPLQMRSMTSSRTRLVESAWHASRSAMKRTVSGSCRCLLYTSDAADDLLCVDLGGRRI